MKGNDSPQKSDSRSLNEETMVAALGKIVYCQLSVVSFYNSLACIVHKAQCNVW